MTVCFRCVMDSTAQEFKPTKTGCNFCDTWHQKTNQTYHRKEELTNILTHIRGSQKPYDSLIGLSGGVDSSYVAYLAWKHELHPLLFHLDNGYDTEESKQNIQRIHEVTDYPLLTIQADPMEFRDLQQAYLYASVINIEAITDHALAAVTYKLAAHHRIKLILNGSNWATEGIHPQSWGYRTDDATNLRQIHRMYGTIRLNTFPTMDLMTKYILTFLYGIKTLSPLNYIKYNREEVKDTLHEAFDWQDYYGKHGESIFTRFYQGYILPTKFGVDKRKMHLSTLICSGQITREQALNELANSVYVGTSLFKADYAFVLKKLGLSAQQFEHVMKLPIKRHQDYPNEEHIINFARSVRRLIK